MVLALASSWNASKTKFNGIDELLMVEYGKALVSLVVVETNFGTHMGKGVNGFVSDTRSWLLLPFRP